MREIIVLIFTCIFFIGIVMIYLLNCVPYKTKRFHKNIFTNKVTAASHECSAPGKGFLRGSSLITVKRIHSGNLKVPLSNAMNLKHRASLGIEDKEMVVPIFVYLIHHETYGYYLIDSGCAASYGRNAFGPMKGCLFPYVMAETILEPDQAIEKQLADLRNKIKGVFFTHLHFDHTSGLPGLPDNLLYIAGKGEKSLSVKGLLEPNHFKKNEVVYMIDFDQEESEKLPIGKEIDLFGDQTLWAISTPGHSKGHVSYLVNTKEHPILITGDAIISNTSLEIGVGPGTSSRNIKLAQVTFDKMNHFIRQNPEVIVWPGHDGPHSSKSKGYKNDNQRIYQSCN